LGRVTLVRAEDSAVHHTPRAPQKLVKLLSTPETTGIEEVAVGMTYCHPGCRGSLHTHKGPEIIIEMHGKGKFFTEYEEHILLT